MLFFIETQDVLSLFDRINMYNIQLAIIKEELPLFIIPEFYRKFDMAEIKVTGITRNMKDPDKTKAVASIYSALAHGSISYFRARSNIYDIVCVTVDSIIEKYQLDPIARISKNTGRHLNDTTSVK